MANERQAEDPFQGIWYASGSGETANMRTFPGNAYVYCGAKATYCAWHRPMAVYAAEVDKTFFVFGNAENSPAISCYDHGAGTFQRPVVLGRNPNMDAHRNPTLLIDEEGHLYVFYGAHGHPTRVVSAQAPYDISQWAPRTDIADPRTSYPQPWELTPGEIFVSYRHPPGWRFRRSRDRAASWEEPQDLIRYRDERSFPYAVTIAESGPWPRKVHIAWSRVGGGTPEEQRTKPLWARRYNVYYACSEDGGIIWRRSDGSAYTLPITEETAEKVYDCGERGVWLKDIQLDSQGSPHVLFVESDCFTYETAWKLASLQERGWRVHDVATSDHMYDHGALVILRDDDFRIYAPTTATQPHEDGGDIEEWRSGDRGETWKNTAHITSGSTYSHNHVRTVLNHERGRGDFRVFWSYGDSVYPPATRDVRMHFYGEALDRAQRIALP